MVLELSEIVIFDNGEVQGNIHFRINRIILLLFYIIMISISINLKLRFIHSIAALDCAKVTADNCEFARNFQSGNSPASIGEEQTISASNSDVTVTGCYIHYDAVDEKVKTSDDGG